MYINVTVKEIQNKSRSVKVPRSQSFRTNEYPLLYGTHGTIGQISAASRARMFFTSIEVYEFIRFLYSCSSCEMFQQVCISQTLYGTEYTVVVYSTPYSR